MAVGRPTVGPEGIAAPCHYLSDTEQKRGLAGPPASLGGSVDGMRDSSAGSKASGERKLTAFLHSFRHSESPFYLALRARNR